MEQTLSPQASHHYQFVTGKLAETAVREVVADLAAKRNFEYSITVLPITVAALMTPKWINRHLVVAPNVTHVILPGYCNAGLDEVAGRYKIPVICGPKDCLNMGELFGEGRANVDLTTQQIEIIAEINHVPRLSIDVFIDIAKSLSADGADVIDIGCDPNSRCLRIGDYVAALVDLGLRVSIDTCDPWEAAEATRRGATLVLSVNSSNRQQAVDWGSEVVAIPDTPNDKKSLQETVFFLGKNGIEMRLDPILEPIGSGFTRSLLRYASTRHDYPETPIMMGIGNLTELTDVDSAGINLLLLGVCAELNVRSVLTTQVINWAQTSVRECDVARRLVHHSITRGVPPKRLSDALVMLRDPKVNEYSDTMLESLAESLKDNNFRIFAQNQLLHLISAGLHLRDNDPFRLFARLIEDQRADNVDPAHAFYLGYELAKATIALTLGKQYTQDEALRFGMLTREETQHRLQRSSRHNR